MFPWTHRSINSKKISITIPAANATKIGAIVTMLTSILGGFHWVFLRQQTA